MNLDEVLVECYDVVFDPKPEAVPYNYRISYMVSLLCLILSKCCHRGTCSLIKLHMISLALFSKSNFAKLLSFSTEEVSTPPIVRFDPAVNKATEYAIADKLIMQMPNGKLSLTDRGKLLVVGVDSDETIMNEEKNSLSNLAKSLTEDKIKNLSENWRKMYAPD